MKRFQSMGYLKIIASFLCLSFIIACSTSHSAGQPDSAPQAQPPGSAQATQPVVDAPTMQSAQTGEQAGEGASASMEVADELHEPPKGSAERQALMDALREVYKNSRNGEGTPNRGNITFVVNYLKVHNGWAWTYAEPHSSDPNDSFGETSGFLLHLDGGRWKVMKLPPMVDDPDDPENLDYPGPRDVTRIKKMYPSVASDIFPKH